jgi:hypothetical protein
VNWTTAMFLMSWTIMRWTCLRGLLRTAQLEQKNSISQKNSFRYVALTAVLQNVLHVLGARKNSYPAGGPFVEEHA